MGINHVPWRVLFFRRVRQGATTECWIWRGHVHKSGYGRYGDWTRSHRAFKELEECLAHRIMWVLHHNKPIPKGLVVRHLCNTPLCVNPSHLKLGTNADNSKDMVNSGRSPKGERSGNSKLTNKEITGIRARRDRGEKLKVIAGDYGVSIPTVSRICSRLIWGHL